MSFRILHVLDHSIPLHSGYTFRTLSILREQRKLGWDTQQITSPKQIHCSVDEENVDGWHFYRTLGDTSVSKVPGTAEWRLMRQLERRLLEVARKLRPDVLHAHASHSGLAISWSSRPVWLPGNGSRRRRLA